MSNARSTREGAALPADRQTFDADLSFLARFAAPLMLLARAMLAYIFVLSGLTYIGLYAGVVDYMQSNGVDGRLLAAGHSHRTWGRAGVTWPQDAFGGDLLGGFCR